LPVGGTDRQVPICVCVTVPWATTFAVERLHDAIEDSVDPACMFLCNAHEILEGLGHQTLGVVDPHERFAQEPSARVVIATKSGFEVGERSFDSL
jgi:hypothetical protein